MEALDSAEEEESGDDLIVLSPPRQSGRERVGVVNLENVSEEEGVLLQRRSPRGISSEEFQRKRSTTTTAQSIRGNSSEEFQRERATMTNAQSSRDLSPEGFQRERDPTTIAQSPRAIFPAEFRKERVITTTAYTNDNGAWSERERWIRPRCRRGRGRAPSSGSSSQPYMDIGRLDPNLGNVGGASISYE